MKTAVKFFVLTVCLALLSQDLLAQTDRKSKPNIILIMADDVGVEAFAAYGGMSYETPRIDQMAEDGMLFKHCYSQPLCTPSRIKIMTGQSNVRNYYDFSLLHPTQETFGHYLQDAGYTTAVTGKWQLYGAEHYKKTGGKGMRPEDAGFDSYRLWQVEKLGSRFANPLVFENGKQLDGKGKYGPDMFTDFAVDFIKTNKDKPFFLYYPMVLVHSPFVPTPDSDRPALNKLSKEERRQACFADMMTYMDKMVGRIIDEVKAQSIEEETLIIFTSDNGTHSSLSSIWNGIEIKGGKGLSTDAGTHVPMVVQWKGTVNANSTTSGLVEFSDFLPTFLECAGVADSDSKTVPEWQDGLSFLPLLKGDESRQRDSIYIYSNPRPTRKKFSFAVFARNQDYKLYSDGRFYRVADDRLEQREINPGSSMDQPAIRQKLQEKLDSMPKMGQLIIEGAVRK